MKGTRYSFNGLKTSLNTGFVGKGLLAKLCGSKTVFLKDFFYTLYVG